MDYAWFLFSFKGRINRARYLAVQLALLTFWLILIYYSSQGKGLHFDWVVTITMVWINAAAMAKRLHDRNRSGWWAVPILILNRLSLVYYGLFFGLSFGVDISIAKELLLVMLAVAISLLQTWVIIELFFVMGTDGPTGSGLIRRVPLPTLPSNCARSRIAYRIFSCVVLGHPPHSSAKTSNNELLQD